MTNIIKTDEEFHDADNQLKLNDVYYGTVGPDAGKAAGQNGIPLLGSDWLPIPGRHTTPHTELGALPQNFAVVLGAIAGLSEQIRQLSIATGVTIDTDEIARKTADEISKRLAGQEGK